MTQDEFIDREIATWGQDYIFDLIDRGYEAVRLIDGTGQMRWSWRLTQPQKYAMLESAASALSFTPV